MFLRHGLHHVDWLYFIARNSIGDAYVSAEFLRRNRKPFPKSRQNAVILIGAEDETA